MSRSRIALRAVAAALVATLAFGAPLAAKPTAHVLLDGLSSPKGLTLAPNGDPVVGQGTFGPAGPVLEYVLRGPGKGSTLELTDPLNLVDIAATPDGAGWAIGGDQMLYRQAAPDAPIEAVLDIAAYQGGDPDPVDQDDFPEESNPYGLTALPTNDVLIADAAANDVIRVTPEGEATTVARFDLQRVSTSHIPPDFPLPPGFELPPRMTAEAVPTAVAIGPGGDAYVSELKGFPFRPGTSHVWRVDPYGEDAWCSVRTPDPSCTVYRDGFTGIQDLAFKRSNGRLYVYELAAGGVLAFEAGFESGEFPPAVLLRVKKHTRAELVPGVLSEPGGIAIGRNGTIFVTDGVFSDGRLLRIRGR